MSENEELERFLKQLGWRKKDLADRLGVTPQGVTKWGKDGLPDYARVYLKEMIETRAAGQALIDRTLPIVPDRRRNRTEK